MSRHLGWDGVQQVIEWTELPQDGGTRRLGCHDAPLDSAGPGK